MADERQSPDTAITLTNLDGTVSDIQDDPDSADGNWCDAINNNVNTICHVTFPTPTGNPTEGAGLQQFKIWVKKWNGTNDPTVAISLYENNVLVTELMSATSVTSTTGELFSITWNANLLGTVDGSLVECYILGVKTGGAAAARATVSVGAVEWNVTYSAGETQQLVSTSDIVVSTTSNLSRGVTEELISTANIATSNTASITRTEELTSISDVVISVTGNLSRGITGELTSTTNIVSLNAGALSRGVTETLISTSNILSSVTGLLSSDKLIYNYFGQFYLP